MLALVVSAAIFICGSDAQTFEPLPPPPSMFPLGLAGLLPMNQHENPLNDPENMLCNLAYPNFTLDSTILSISNSIPQTRLDLLLRDSPLARAYADNLVARDEAMNQARQQDPLVPNGPQLEFRTETAKTRLCRTDTRRVQSVNNNGDECFTFQAENVEYAQCMTQEADVPNVYPEVSRWFCIPDSFRYVTFLVICPNTAEQFRWHTISVPTNCCARRFECDFTAYPSLDGPRLFP